MLSLVSLDLWTNHTIASRFCAQVLLKRIKLVNSNVRKCCLRKKSFSCYLSYNCCHCMCSFSSASDTFLLYWTQFFPSSERTNFLLNFVEHIHSPHGNLSPSGYSRTFQQRDVSNVKTLGALHWSLIDFCLILFSNGYVTFFYDVSW